MAAYKGVVATADYTFDKTAKTITFSANYTGIALSDIMYITNVKSGTAIVIYDPSDSTKGGSLSGLVLTLAYDTSAMLSADPLQIIVAMGTLPISVTSSVIDSTSLYSNTLSVKGAISGIDTTGYQNVIAQITGQWAGSFWFEGSNDNSTWQELMVMSIDELSMQDTITCNGTYQIKTTTKWIRINVLDLEAGSITSLLLGRTTPGISGADLLSYAMDKNNNLPLYVAETQSKKDQYNALVPSDAPQPIYCEVQAVGAVLFQVDTIGYQTVAIQVLTAGSSFNVQTSNDGSTWVALLGFSQGNTTPAALVSTLGMSIFPVTGRFVRGLTVGANFINAVIYLRQTPLQNAPTAFGLTVNLGGIAGSTPITAGVSGVQAIGGNMASGVAPTANPIPLTIDTSGLTRRILTDIAGRLLGATLDETNTTRAVGSVAPQSTNQNVAPIAVADLSQFEGQGFVELLGAILLELRIQNQYMYEMPRTLQKLLHDTKSEIGTFGNEPQEYRSEQSIFNN